MYLVKHSLNLKTDASGDAVGYTPPVNGFIRGISYIKSTADAFADAVVVLMETEDSAMEIWSESGVSASKELLPLYGATDKDGAAITGSYASMPVADERIKVTVSGGGNAKNGTFILIVG